MADLVSSLLVESTSKIVLVVMDGLGGMRTAERGTELQEAWTPSLDALARGGSSGLHTVVDPGVTPGSGVGHLALFGYDPREYELGRGVLSAAGVGFDLKPSDIAARVNFCTIDDRGIVVDRRAGRISNEVNQKLCAKVLGEIDLSGRAEVFLVTERDHRALLVLRGAELSPKLADTDPQTAGLAPREPNALEPQAEKTASIVRDFLSQARSALEGEQANFLLLRGFDTLRELPSFSSRYGLDALGIAGYPMYLGISRLLGMKASEPQVSFSDEIGVLESHFGRHDFFYVHQKKTDSAGEDGDFAQKVEAIQEVDGLINRIVDLKPSVICVTGDHATPSPMRAHSWHPVPFLMWGGNVGVDSIDRFDEESARGGAFGQVSAKHLMALMLAAAGRLAKYGA